MRSTLLVLKHEIWTLVRRFSFWFGVLGVPLLGFIILTAVDYVNKNNASGAESASPLAQVGQIFQEEEDARPQGYVDLSALIQRFPSDFPFHEWIGYPDEAAARADLAAGKISALMVIAPDYIQSGQIIVYTPEYDPINSQSRSAGLSRLLSYNLMDGNDDLVSLVRSPILETTSTVLEPDHVVSPRSEDNMAYFFLPYGIMMLFYITILGSAGMLLNSIGKEKENRVIEVLLLSTRPLQLFMGKIIGLGLVGLLQLVIWLVSSLSLATLSGKSIPALAGLQLPPHLLLWGVIFYILGYMIYASFMAGIGALVPNLREASQATTIVILPLMIPMFLISPLIEKPNSVLAVVLSLFPLTSPTTMMLRLAATQVPLWQILSAIVLLILAGILTIRAVTGLFRAQTLLSGQPFKIKGLFKALAGKG